MEETKLTTEEIKKLLADGISKAEIARRLNLSRASIYNFLKNHQN